MLARFTDFSFVKDMVALFGGLRFRHMDFFGVECVRLLLGACAETLETLKLYPTDPYGEYFLSRTEGNELTRGICWGKPALASTFRPVAERVPPDTRNDGGVDYCSG
jgi:hypothetical protein